jgi:hypothetical protein
VAELRELIAWTLMGGGTYPWGVRVVETSAADPDLTLSPFPGEMPWLLVRNAGTTLDLNRVETHAFEISVYSINTSFAIVDVLERLVVQILNDQVLVDPSDQVGRRYVMRYSGTVQGDIVVPVWDAYVRTLRFEGTGTGLTDTFAAPDDPRAVYLRAHAAELFGQLTGGSFPCVQTDPATWNPRDDCPGVYFRPDSGPTELRRMSGITFFRETLAGSVLAETQAAREAWLDALTLALPGQIDYFQPQELDSHGNRGRTSTMYLRVTNLNPAADPWAVGQLRIEVEFSALEPHAPPYTWDIGTAPPGWPPGWTWPPQTPPPGWPPGTPWPPAWNDPWPPGVPWPPYWPPGVTPPGWRWDSLWGDSEFAGPIRSIRAQPGGPELDDKQGPWIAQPRGPDAPEPAPPHFPQGASNGRSPDAYRLRPRPPRRA